MKFHQSICLYVGILALMFTGCKTKEAEIQWVSNQANVISHPPAGMKLIKGGQFRIGGLPGTYDKIAEEKFVNTHMPQGRSPLPMRTVEDISAAVNASPETSDGFWHQFPSKVIEVGDYFMDSTEVTEKQWFDLMGGPSDEAKGDSFPASRRSWYHAILYCNAKSKKFGLDTVYRYSGINKHENYATVVFYDTSLLDVWIDMTKNGFRLPTEAEFEYAARAGSDSKYPWGNIEDTKYGWWDNALSSEIQVVPSPVATKKPNAWGIYDLIGNFIEWTNDAYDTDYYSWIPSKDPMGAEDPRKPNRHNKEGIKISGSLKVDSESPRVTRSADWNGGRVLVPSRFRDGIPPMNYYAGFRTVLQVR